MVKVAVFLYPPGTKTKHRPHKSPAFRQGAQTCQMAMKESGYYSRGTTVFETLGRALHQVIMHVHTRWFWTASKSWMISQRWFSPMVFPRSINHVWLYMRFTAL